MVPTGAVATTTSRSIAATATSTQAISTAAIGLRNRPAGARRGNPTSDLDRSAVVPAGVRPRRHASVMRARVVVAASAAQAHRRRRARQAVEDKGLRPAISLAVSASGARRLATPGAAEVTRSAVTGREAARAPTVLAAPRAAARCRARGRDRVQVRVRGVAVEDVAAVVADAAAVVARRW
jgi:hypothetical protein